MSTPLRTQAVWLGWDDYLAWLAGKLTDTANAAGEPVRLGPAWTPGMHKAMIGPTGEGKTTHAVGVLKQRKYVFALDPKGEDETLSASGFIRVRDVPRRGARAMLRQDQRQWREIHKRIDDGLPVRLIAGGGANTDADDLRNQQLMRDAITYVRQAGGWTLYVDEFELLSSQRMFRLGPLIERMLITARRAGTSVVTSYQAQAWVSNHATRQASHAVIWPTGSRPLIKNMAEAMGRDWRELGAAIDELPRYHTLTVPRGPRGGPLVITKAPKIN